MIHRVNDLATHDEGDEAEEHPDLYGGLGLSVFLAVRLHEHIGKAGRERYSRDNQEQRRIAEFEQLADIVHWHR